ncbi:Mov34-domain-containing protein [Rozella allomycis CSF55]|uniref:Mov34-domain-containing protein n=1 Tax=Rozella allomycis (strain CSF55) TaxID=988480 RepID=A0A075AT96_ROZAC|nr:Rpn11/EIF3F domain-containing protein [Rozella allomycis CSF55]RKP20963.1 Mov34-domain-containing protein [Rozella allomycis CSF55]|eukprot:EPZ33496.1 Rpn11/EIF3F domain-containing protein [Rozella allomycis CSF55]
MTVPDSVIVHPLVLLSAVDHYNRVAQNTKKRVVGALLGQWQGGAVHITNSYALPFEEDEKDPSVWFIDHNFHENMYSLCKKVNAKEKPVGWYHSGPKLRSADLKINELFKKYTQDPILVVIDVKMQSEGLPIDSYVAVDEISDDGTSTIKTFAHISSFVDAEEAEEIGVEHLLRDIKDLAVGSLSSRVTEQVNSLKGLVTQMQDIERYLEKVLNGQLSVNHPILYNLQKVFNLMPNTQSHDLAKAITTTVNDQYAVTYIASMVRSITALHDLINNKITNKEDETKRDEVVEKKTEMVA